MRVVSRHWLGRCLAQGLSSSAWARRASFMSVDASFPISPRGFDDVMACMEEALPHVQRKEFEDTWAKAMHYVMCASFWAAAGYGQAGHRLLLVRLDALFQYGIWGASAADLEPHPTRAGRCLVPTRYRKECHGWQEIYTGDVNLYHCALRCRKLLAILAWRLSKRPAARQVMLWCLLAMQILKKILAQVAKRLGDPALESFDAVPPWLGMD